MFSCCKSRYPVEMSVDLVYSDALTEVIGGTIKCIPHGMAPFIYEWTHMDGTSATKLQLSNDRSSAEKVPPGKYNITITDANMQSVNLTAEIRVVNIPIICSYKIEKYPSSDTARNGKIRCDVLNNVNKNLKYLWTDGVITHDPVLENVSPGLYSAIIIDEFGGLLPCCHACVPIEVSVEASMCSTTRDSQK